MYSFSYRGRTRTGELRTARVEAASVDEAWQKLDAMDFEKVELLDDVYSAVRLADPGSRQRLEIDAATEIRLRAEKSIFRRTVLIFFGAGNLVVWGPLLAWLVYALLFAQAYVIAPAVLLTGFAVWFLWASVPSIIYDRALDASVWGKWEQVERYMKLLRWWKNSFGIPLPEHELRFRLATAEAGQGRMQEALERVAPLQYDQTLPPGLYTGRLASLYFAACDFQKVADLQHEVHRTNPTASSAIDLAMTLARRFGNTTVAQSLLSDIDIERMPPVAQAFVQFCRGIIAFEERRFEEACALLEQSIRTGAVVGTVLMNALVLDARAWYAMTLLALGDTDSADRHFNATLPFLQARREHALIARYEGLRSGAAS